MSALSFDEPTSTSPQPLSNSIEEASCKQLTDGALGLQQTISCADSEEFKGSNSNVSITFIVKSSDKIVKHLNTPSPFLRDIKDGNETEIIDFPEHEAGSDECANSECLLPEEKEHTSPVKDPKKPLLGNTYKDISIRRSRKKRKYKSERHGHKSDDRSLATATDSDDKRSKSSEKQRQSSYSRSKSHSQPPNGKESVTSKLVAYNSSADGSNNLNRQGKKNPVEKRGVKRPRSKTMLQETQAEDEDKVELASIPISEVKVVKTTAKSTWDSSDSDFEVTPVEVSQTNSVTRESSVKNELDHTDCRSVHSNSKSSDHKTSSNSRDSARGIEATETEHIKSKPDQTRSKLMDQKRHRSSQSSRKSSASIDHDKESTRTEKCSKRQSRSPSHRHSHSYRSRSDSEYSSDTSRSSEWRYRRHSRRSRRRRSKSYTSHSSSEDDHSNYYSRYRERTKSRSRSDKRRRHLRLSYRRRRYRRYSLSRSRSQSWCTSDSRSSFRSSRSRTSSNNSHSHHSSAARKSPSISNHLKTEASEYLRTPPRLPDDVDQYSAVDAQKLFEKSKSTYADTISAAVKLVTGGKLSIRETTPNATVSTLHNPNQGGLVDIPLPRDVSEAGYTQELHEIPTRSEPAPYIGPQLPPELAKHYGLVVPDSSSLSEQKDIFPSTSTAKSTAQGMEQTTATSASTSSSEFLIPPEKVEHYRALQEQAKQHALRRNMLASVESTNTTFSANALPVTSAPMGHIISPAFDFQAQHQAALLQHLSRDNSMLVSSMYSPVVANSLTTAGNTLMAGTTPEHLLSQHLAQLSEEARLRSLSTMLGVQNPHQTQTSFPPNVLMPVVSVHSPTMVNRVNNAATERLSTNIGPSTTSITRFPGLELSMVNPALSMAQLQQQLQSSQAQLFLSQMAALQQANMEKNLQSQQLQAAYASQLLATQQRLPTMNTSPESLQQKIQVELRKQALEALQKNAASTFNERFQPQLNVLGDLSHQVPSTGFNPSLVVANSTPRMTTLPLQEVTVHQPHQQHPASLAAVMAAAQQQQQLLAAANYLRQPSVLQPGFSLTTAQPVTSAQGFLPAIFAAQQQQLLLKALQQRQQLQQPQTVSMPTVNAEALQYAQFVALQQKQQQALALLAARVQQHQQAHGGAGKPT